MRRDKFLLRGFGEDARFQLKVIVDGYVLVNWSVAVKPDGFEYRDRPVEVNARDAEAYKRSLAKTTKRIPTLEIVMQPTARFAGE